MIALDYPKKLSWVSTVLGCYLSTLSDFLRGIEANHTAFEWEVKGISSLQISH